MPSLSSGLPKLSRICTSYSPITYTPEFDPFGTMNSSSMRQSPNVCSVKMSHPPPLVLTRDGGLSSLKAAPSANWPGLPVSSTGEPGSACHLLFFSSLSFQPLRSLPLNGWTGVGSEGKAAGAASTTAARGITRQRMGETPDVGTGREPTHGDATRRE